jgi:hypothetical protein
VRLPDAAPLLQLALGCCCSLCIVTVVGQAATSAKAKERGRIPAALARTTITTAATTAAAAATVVVVVLVGWRPQR